jgi:predicted nucleic-acid-binding Zn-ribbon protein
MKSGVCPKCKSEEVYVDNGIRHGIVVPIHALSVHPTELYVCANCGFLEFYAHTEYDLSLVKERFRKVKAKEFI